MNEEKESISMIASKIESSSPQRDGSKLLEKLASIVPSPTGIYPDEITELFNEVAKKFDKRKISDPEDQKEFFRLCELAAKQGYAPAQNGLGICYELGLGVKKNHNKAFRCYQLAVDQGHADAQYHLAWQFEFGFEVEKNEKEALRLHRLAADQGHAEAQFRLGSCYLSGSMVGEDKKEAFRWFQLAAAQGHSSAQYHLGICYENGFGVGKNYDIAVLTYKLSAANGNKYAEDKLKNLPTSNLIINELNDLGIPLELAKIITDYDDFSIYDTYSNQVLLDKLESLIKSSSTDIHVIQEIKVILKELGKRLELGQIAGQKERIKFAALCELAANQNYAQAQYNLGYIFFYGIGVQENQEKATLYFRLAADQGHAPAQFFLGYCYEHNFGVEQDHKEVLTLYRPAVDQGNADAQFRLGRYYQIGLEVEKDDAEAFRLYKLSADQGNSEAQFYLGSCYQEGIGVKQDKKEAKKWIRLAAENGHATATKLLRQDEEKSTKNSNEQQEIDDQKSSLPTVKKSSLAESFKHFFSSWGTQSQPRENKKNNPSTSHSVTNSSVIGSFWKKEKKPAAPQKLAPANFIRKDIQKELASIKSLLPSNIIGLDDSSKIIDADSHEDLLKLFNEGEPVNKVCTAIQDLLQTRYHLQSTPEYFRLKKANDFFTKLYSDLNRLEPGLTTNPSAQFDRA